MDTLHMPPRLRPLDVEFLVLGLDGPFGVQQLADLALGRLDTGRMLDTMGSLLERGLICKQGDGFVLSEEARAYLWDRSTPLQTRMLRLLDIMPLEIPRIKSYLGEADIEAVLRSLQEEGMVQSYPVLREGVPVPVFQTTGEGSVLLGGSYDAAVEISGMMREISGWDTDATRKAAMLARLQKLQRHLGARSSGRGSAPE